MESDPFVQRQADDSMNFVTGSRQHSLGPGTEGGFRDYNFGTSDLNSGNHHSPPTMLGLNDPFTFENADSALSSGVSQNGLTENVRNHVIHALNLGHPTKDIIGGVSRTFNLDITKDNLEEIEQRGIHELKVLTSHQKADIRLRAIAKMVEVIKELYAEYPSIDPRAIISIVDGTTPQ